MTILTIRYELMTTDGHIAALKTGSDDLKERVRWAINYAADKYGVTNKKLSELLGYSTSTISSYRTKITVPGLDFFALFLYQYQLSLEWFATGRGEPFPGAREKYPEVCGPEEQELQRLAPPADQEVNKVPASAPVGTQRPSIKVSDALVMASRVLESGTTYADALYTNIVHFDRAVLAEGKAPAVSVIAGNQDVERLLMEIRTAVRNLEKGALVGLSFKDLIHFVGKSISLEDVLDILLEKAMLATGAQIGSILIKDKTTGGFRMAAYRSPGKGLPKGVPVEGKDSLTQIVLTKKESLLVENIETDPRTRRPNDPKYGAPSFLAVPILAGEEVDGIVNLARKESNKLFDRADEEILRQIIPEVSAALKKSTIPNGHHSE